MDELLPFDFVDLWRHIRLVVSCDDAHPVTWGAHLVSASICCVRGESMDTGQFLTSPNSSTHHDGQRHLTPEDSSVVW